MQDRPRPRRRAATAALSLAVLGVFGATGVSIVSPAAFAADKSWITPTGGTFSVATNWSPSPPISTDNAIFNLSAPSPYTVSFTVPAQTAQLRVGKDNVVFALAGVTYNST